MEDAYIINGGKRLSGHIKVSGAKNVALKAIIASLLFKGPVILKNVPRINDVFELLELIKAMGGRAGFIDQHTVEVDGRGLNKKRVDLFHGSKIRVSFMLLPVLLYRFGEAYIPNPGGCRIGARPIDRVVKGVESLGVRMEYSSKTGYYYGLMKDQPQGFFHFPKPTHTGTETLILLSLFSDQQVVLSNCALEPEIDQLIEFLNQSGARIIRQGKRIIVTGVRKLEQKKPFMIEGDRNEAVTYAVLGIASRGKVEVSGLDISLLEAFVKKLKEANGSVEIKSQRRIVFSYQGRLKAVNVETAPHPGFMTDWQPPWAVLMTQAQGKSIIHERVFEDRFGYVSELKKLGARIEFLPLKIENKEDFYFFNFDPDKELNQAVEIEGPIKLHNGVLKVSDLRAGATLAIAALIAKGESVVNGVSILERGYEDFVDKVKGLGGEIRKV